MVDFVKISQESVNKYKDSCDSCETVKYVNTLYVAISESNKVTCAYDPVILKDAYQCILIHCKYALAISNWYNWYKAEFINHDGVNLEGIIGNDCSFKVDMGLSYSNQVMKLYHRIETIYTCCPPFERHMQGLWDAYCNTYNEEQDDTALLRDELAKNEKRIKDLEMQVNQYKQMLAGLKEIISNFKE